MPRASHTDVPMHGLVVTDARDGAGRDLGGLAGVNVMVLMRHRH